MLDTELRSKPKFEPGTSLPALSPHLPLHRSVARRKHIARPEGSLNRVCKGVGRVKGTYKWWWDTRGLTAIGSCFVTTCGSEERKGAITGSQDGLCPEAKGPQDRGYSCNLEGGSCCPTCQRESRKNIYVHFSPPTALWSVSASHWTNPTGSQKVRGQPPRHRAGWRVDGERQMEDIPARTSQCPTCLAFLQQVAHPGCPPQT